jgi:raffinose/stachyose/melibiose transport system permease protein
MKQRSHRPGVKVAIAILGFALVALYLFPFAMVLVNSVKPRLAIVADPLALPAKADFSNYVNAFRLMRFPRAFWNSLGVCVSSVVLIVVFSSLWAYYLVRWKNLINRIVFFVLIASMIVPFQALMIPFVSIYGGLGLLNSKWLLSVFYLGFGCALATFMYHGFIKSIPLELEEAAMIDGATKPMIFIKIIFPMLTTMTSTICILDVLWVWNDFLLPSLVLVSEEKRTLPLSTFYFFGKYTSNYGTAMAALVLSILPVIIFYLAMQRKILQGVVDGAIK